MVVEKENSLEIRKVLVLYVGGTIGMKKNHEGVYIPSPNELLNKLKYHSQMHDTEYANHYFTELDENQLVLPPLLKLSYVILYEIVEYDPIVDSSDMNIQHWQQLAKDIENNYDNYNGFVILHGTDTLAYTSSALSFMLENLQKPVILTGSQIPIFETRSDAKENILSSLLLAASYDIPEVSVFFSRKLHRGNRTSKLSSDLLDAFSSPNYHNLADVGINILVHHHYILKSNGPLKVHCNLNKNVGMIIMFPTITAQMLKSFLEPPVEGLVLQTYGAGNIPTQRVDLIKVLSDAVQRGIIIVSITQCAKGSVSPSYGPGKVLEDIGIISGYDMTATAAVTKLCYVLNKPISYEEKIKLMKTNIRGELTCL